MTSYDLVAAYIGHIWPHMSLYRPDVTSYDIVAAIYLVATYIGHTWHRMTK